MTMLEFYATAYPNSGLSNTSIDIKSPYFSFTQSLSAGGHWSTVLNVPQYPFRVTPIEFEIALSNDAGSVTSYIKDVPDNSTIHIFGINQNLFLGHIFHAPQTTAKGQTAPKCQLRCNPTKPPILGPGCLDCKDGTLVFKVCC
jgi:hypothetical protein